MKKNNTIAIVIALVLLVIAGILIGNNSYLSTLNDEASDFTVYDTASITKLFLADKSGNQVLLRRTDSCWIVNDEFPASQKMINKILYTLNRMRIKMPVSNKKSDGIITRMSSTNTKVEIYQMMPRINLFNKVKLFYHEKCSKVFYIGNVTRDNMGTYVLKEGSDKVFIAHLNGLRGFISSRFTANPTDWRDHLIFNEQLGNIKSLKLEIYNDPDNGFIINENGRYQYTMSRLNGQPVEFDTLRVLNLMSSFNNVRFEAFLDDIKPERRDSIINSPFQQRLTLTTKDGKSVSVTTYNMRANADMYDYSEEDINNFDDMIKDPDHKYALLSEGNEFVLIQDFVFGKLLKPADFYSRDYHEEVPQIYYQELETIESY
ncbi:MAG: DUF4340 domain-containing protein [Bacteroidales bacterium]|nr:DUF4340 domain-containing protein [Bacteroidales bacterium]MBR6439368.1 DUF4340 domain-containing protein [Bacteroidales bacterium]